MFLRLTNQGFVLLLLVTLIRNMTSIPIKTPGKETDSNYSETEVEELKPTRALQTKPKAILWPRGEVFYKFDEDFRDHEPERKMILIAMKTIEVASCIRFLPRREKDQNYLLYRLSYYGDPACASRIGMIGGEQDIIISIGACDNYKGNYAGSAAHEIMHALGFRHEFQRRDRDQYIKYIGDATGQAYQVNFGLQDGKSFSIPFNFASITQYDPATGFAEVKRASNVKEPLGSFKNMGQECSISPGDRNLINRAYQQNCGLEIVPKHTAAVYINGTNCNKKLAPMNDVTA